MKFSEYYHPVLLQNKVNFIPVTKIKKKSYDGAGIKYIFKCVNTNLNHFKSV